jgi:hypothetical protein
MHAKGGKFLSVPHPGGQSNYFFASLPMPIVFQQIFGGFFW